MGFGDSTVPAPTKIRFPTFLEMGAPELRAYAPETVIAEKLEAMISLGIANTRTKEFFDTDYMASVFEFEGGVFQKAVRATLKRRQTALPDGLPLALTNEFAEDEGKVRQWHASEKKLGTHAAPRLLAEVMMALRQFLGPVLATVSTDKPPGTWKAGGPWKT